MQARSFLSLALMIFCTGIGIAETKADLSNFDGIPIGVSEEQVLDKLDQLAPPVPSPTPRSTQAHSFDCPPSGGSLQCTIAALNRNRPRRSLIVGPDYNAGLTPTQIRARAYNANHSSCAGSGNAAAHGVYDAHVFANLSNRTVVIEFEESDPSQSCDVINTEVYSNQPIKAQTVEAQRAIEDKFISAAKAQFGEPTYFIPRHIGSVVNNHQSENNLSTLNNILGAGNNSPIAPTVEKRMIDPEIAWCDSGTVADCKSGGPTVNRRLLLSFVHYDGEVAAVDLKDFRAIRQILARTTKSNVEQAKPQL